VTDADLIAYLRSPGAIRDRCGQLFDLACADQLHYFRCDLDSLDSVATYVLAVTEQYYPDGNVPFHSRWRHFEVGGNARLAKLEQALADLPALERAKAKVDLAVISVLLDAGAGANWSYTEASTGQVFQRSEGLAVASFWLFYQGSLSSQPERPFQADALALEQLTPEALASSFQVTVTNPLVGLAGRTQLLQTLGRSLLANPALFGPTTPRPGNLIDYLLQHTQPDGSLTATQIFTAVLTGLADIWPGRLTLAGANLGDVWMHPALQALGGVAADPSPKHAARAIAVPSTPPPIESISPSPFPDPQQLPVNPALLVPFHKLSQWLTYSLLEPLQELGIAITGLDALTGLPEYRNGGLCLDLGLLQVKDKSILEQPQAPASEAIVEWRALTVILLDQIAATLRQKMGQTAEQLPLVKVLQGGTWTAGRRIAAKLRPNGVPPIQIESDGTVF
jgi:hypothetical protein